MQITIELDEQKIESAVISECVRYVKDKQMQHMLHEVAKQVAQDIKGEVVDSGLVEKRVEEVVKRVENSLMTRVNRQFGETMDKALDISASAIDKKPQLNGDGKMVRDHMIAAIIGFQNEIGCDESSEAYQAYQAMLDAEYNCYHKFSARNSRIKSEQRY